MRSCCNRVSAARTARSQSRARSLPHWPRQRSRGANASASARRRICLRRPNKSGLPQLSSEVKISRNPRRQIARKNSNPSLHAMKTTHPSLAALIAVLAVTAPRVEAIDRYWNPTIGVNWATGANWSGGIAPSNALDIAVFDSNFSNPSVSGIVHPGGIRYDSTASASYINGGTIGLYSAGITHNDNSTQVINSGVFLYANQTWGGPGVVNCNWQGMFLHKGRLRCKSTTPRGSQRPRMSQSP